MNIAIIGATGVVGLEMLSQLYLYNLNDNYIDLYASKNSEGKTIKYNEDSYEVKCLSEDINFSKYDVALFSADSALSKKYANYFAKNNCYVIDNSSAFRMDNDKVLIVPEINSDKLNESTKIIANPNCSTIQSVIAFYKLVEYFNIVNIDYTTYQSVSGSGSKGLIDLLQNKHEFYDKDINDNIIMQIDEFDEFGNTYEELKMINETNKILDKDIEITATCVRVPVSYGHGVSIKLTFEEQFDIDELTKYLTNDSSIEYILTDREYKTPKEVRQSNKVFVSRIRQSKDKKSLLIFSVTNNIKKGAAANAVQILVSLKEKGLICTN